MFLGQRLIAQGKSLPAMGTCCVLRSYWRFTYMG
jgi:hypothetical protein